MVEEKCEYIRSLCDKEKDKDVFLSEYICNQYKRRCWNYMKIKRDLDNFLEKNNLELKTREMK